MNSRVFNVLCLAIPVLILSTILASSEYQQQTRRKRSWIEDFCGSYYADVQRMSISSLNISMVFHKTCENAPINAFPVRFQVYLKSWPDGKRKKLQSIACNCHRKRMYSKIYKIEASSIGAFIVSLVPCCGSFEDCSVIKLFLPPYTTTSTMMTDTLSTVVTNVTASTTERYTNSEKTLLILVAFLVVTIILMATSMGYIITSRCKQRLQSANNQTPQNNGVFIPLVPYNPADGRCKRVLFIEYPPSRHSIMLKVLAEIHSVEVIDIQSSSGDIFRNDNDWIQKTIDTCDTIIVALSEDLNRLIVAEGREENNPLANVTYKLIEKCNECHSIKYVVMYDNNTDCYKNFIDKFKSFKTCVFNLSTSSLLEHYSNSNLNGMQELQQLLMCLRGEVDIY